VIDLPGFSNLADFQQAHRQWVEIALRDELSVRDARWSEAVAVGSLAFVEKVKSELGIKAPHRELEQVDGTYALRESGEAYRGQFDSKNEALRPENTLSWERITEVAAT
jgi:putative transposase